MVTVVLDVMEDVINVAHALKNQKNSKKLLLTSTVLQKPLKVDVSCCLLLHTAPLFSGYKKAVAETAFYSS